MNDQSETPCTQWEEKLAALHPNDLSLVDENNLMHTSQPVLRARERTMSIKSRASFYKPCQPIQSLIIFQ